MVSSVLMPSRSWSARCHTAVTSGERLSSRFVASSHAVTSARSYSGPREPRPRSGGKSSGLRDFQLPTVARL